MPFTLLNISALDRFSRKHRDAAKPLADWLHTMTRADWQSIADLRRVYPSADSVPVGGLGGHTIVMTVFDTRDHHCRLLTVINFAAGLCRVVVVLTKDEYSTDRWKDRL